MLNDSGDVVGTTRMVRPSGQPFSRTAATQVHAKRPNPSVKQLAADSDHVRALMTSGKAVHQQHDPFARLPARRAVVMQDENVAIRECDLVAICVVLGMTPGQEDAGESLSVSVTEQAMRLKRGEDDFHSVAMVGISSFS